MHVKRRPGDKSLPPAERKAVHAIRRKNLIALLEHLIDNEEFRNDTEFANAVGVEPSIISNYKNDASGRNMGDAIATRIEIAMGLPDCALDLPEFNVDDSIKLRIKAQQIALDWMRLDETLRQDVRDRIDGHLVTQARGQGAREKWNFTLRQLPQEAGRQSGGDK